MCCSCTIRVSRSGFSVFYLFLSFPPFFLSLKCAFLVLVGSLTFSSFRSFIYSSVCVCVSFIYLFIYLHIQFLLLLLLCIIYLLIYLILFFFFVFSPFSPFSLLLIFTSMLPLFILRTIPTLCSKCLTNYPESQSIYLYISVSFVSLQMSFWEMVPLHYYYLITHFYFEKRIRSSKKKVH